MVVRVLGTVLAIGRSSESPPEIAEAIVSLP